MITHKNYIWKLTNSLLTLELVYANLILSRKDIGKRGILLNRKGRCNYGKCCFNYCSGRCWIYGIEVPCEEARQDRIQKNKLNNGYKEIFVLIKTFPFTYITQPKRSRAGSSFILRVLMIQLYQL